jgi:hypothetical protein
MAPEFGTPIHQLPLIPADVLKKHRVPEPLDTRFRSVARLLQALQNVHEAVHHLTHRHGPLATAALARWNERNQLPFGVAVEAPAIFHPPHG